jgi:guanosine-3',5'-bis(diphosphate) 3'-pyrophosphohydrolase
MTIEAQDLQRLLAALSFAAARHQHQRRKDSDASPYINHPVALANILCNEGQVTDIEVLCAALLHDTLEDTDTSTDELQALFGQEVRDIVVEVSDDKSLPKAERKRLQVERAAAISAPAKLVKLADKISNLRDVADCPPPDWSLQRRQAYFDWSREVVDRLRGVHPQLEAVFDAAYARRPR